LVPSSTLRVYQPLESFPRDEQAYWERYLVTRTRSPEIRPRLRDHPTTPGLGYLTPDDGEHAEILVVEDRTYVSPWRSRLRSLAGVVAFHDARPFDLAERFVPKKEARRAARELRRARRRDPGLVAFCHVSPWFVPIRWFALFDDEDRILSQEVSGDLRMRYRTGLRTALRRAEFAVPVLRRSDLAAVAGQVLELHEWMRCFDVLSILELDYGPLCDAMTWGELEEDHSARDVQRSLEALAAYDYPRSTDLYRSVLVRWAEARSREGLS
jgi:hypothetical protein